MSLPKRLPTSQRAAASAVASGLVAPSLITSIHSQSSPPSFSNPAPSTTASYSITNHRTLHCQSKQNQHLLNQLTPRHTANMSTMPAQHGHSEACCNIPPVVSKGYAAKGGYEVLGGYASYVTGPKDATKGIIAIYDIFGYYPQTIQGADILSTSDKSQKYKVFIPDWFKGAPADLSWFPPDTEEKQKNLGAFFQKHPPPSVAEKVPDYVKAVSDRHPEIKSWAIIGYCWGGKVVSLVTSSADTVFKAGVELHPAMVDPSEATNIKIPLAMLASKDEPPEDVRKFEANLQGPKHVEIFADQIHGWMAARSDLDNDRVRAEYTRGYETVLKFLSQHV
ncbi:hypothetical protein F4779DRAFT_573389 [Xylariaceae sp. FL0662B]|nr:hypothetical protein F4779DRAFT_573389 [Xylariaceae sp. FL0662B]